MSQGEITIDRFPTVCFAPPLSDQLLAEYAAVADGPAVRPEVRGAVRALLVCVRQWWELPESRRTDGDRFKLRHQGKETVVHFAPLEEDHQAALSDAIPWGYELDAIQKLFDAISDAEVPLRNAAFHLLWHVRELCLDREPVTRDKL